MTSFKTRGGKRLVTTDAVIRAMRTTTAWGWASREALTEALTGV